MGLNFFFQQPAKANKDGALSDTLGNLASNILYVDADQLMTENAYLSGAFSGAHSDIYRAEHGVFLYQAINRKPQPVNDPASAALGR